MSAVVVTSRVFAPRLSPRLLDVIHRQARKPLRYAEINRRVGTAASRLGLPRPSYERVRTLIHLARWRAQLPTLATVTRDVIFRARPPDAIIAHVAGVGVRPLEPLLRLPP